MDIMGQIESAIRQALKLFRSIDAVSEFDLESMRDEGLIDAATFRQIAGRTDASDFMSLLSSVKARVSDATDDKIVEMLIAMEVVEIIEGGPERSTIKRLLKGVEARSLDPTFDPNATARAVIEQHPAE